MAANVNGLNIVRGIMLQPINMSGVEKDTLVEITVKYKNKNENEWP